VIEHVPQPQLFLRDIYRLLLPGGLLYLTTPDISHWRRPRKLENWDGFCPPSHLLYFNPANLISLVQRCGFELVSRRPAWKPGVKLVLRRPL
jgi:2-polyprenyl-3-methyl-5-hydroxy-6-metoxy-1,4-benzoquinol methylase